MQTCALAEPNIYLLHVGQAGYGKLQLHMTTFAVRECFDIRRGVTVSNFDYCFFRLTFYTMKRRSHELVVLRQQVLDSCMVQYIIQKPDVNIALPMLCTNLK
jgi:hypothetical protein